MEDRSREELEDEIELLRQQLSLLKGSDRELGVLMALKHGMTHRLATILLILVKRAPAVISRDTLHRLLFGDRSDGGPDPKIFNVYMARLRDIIKRKGRGKIETVWHAGFRASPELVSWIEELWADQIRQEK
jgi:DNA-binding winged helix-turn-helix (wHTH) protein